MNQITAHPSLYIFSLCFCDKPKEEYHLHIAKPVAEAIREGQKIYCAHRAKYDAKKCDQIQLSGAHAGGDVQ